MIEEHACFYLSGLANRIRLLTFTPTTHCKTVLIIPGTTGGMLRSSNGFSFLRVYDAGHMVPRDQPAVALAMLNAFIAGTI